LFYLAGVARLELATIGFGDRCSTNWNYTPVDEGHYAKTTTKGKVLFIIKCSIAVFSGKLANLVNLCVDHTAK
tara:strand:- start:734 stop:952 length:219 start_codon:yes stop_codon:yes gene_type:complete